MRKRIGWIFVISGFLLLFKPSLDVDMILLSIRSIVIHYWPAGFVFVGALLLWPQKRPASKKKRG